MSDQSMTQKAVRKRGAGRNEIMKAALSEFAIHGYTGTSTATIARRAGVTQPLIYHHFSSKRVLWQATLDHAYDDFRDTRAAAVKQTEHAPLVEQMKAMLVAFVHFSASHAEIARIVVLESAIGGDSYDYLYKNYLEPEFTALKALVQAGQKQGVIRKLDQKLLPFLIIGAGVHPFVVPETIRRTTGLNPLDPAIAEQYANMIVDALFEGLLQNPA